MPDTPTKKLGSATWLSKYDKQKLRKMYECESGGGGGDPSPVVGPRPTTKICRTYDRVTCVFPFKYKGVTYNECTKVDSDSPWCANRVDSDGKVVYGEWGDCAQGCPGTGAKTKTGGV